MQNNPLNKVVFIQKVAAFTHTKSVKGLLELAYVNNSWNDTIKNYSFHLFEQRVRDIENINALEFLFCAVLTKCEVLWFVGVLTSSKTVLERINLPMLACKIFPSSVMLQLIFEQIEEVGGKGLLKSQLSAKNDFGWTCLAIICSYASSREVAKLVFEKIVEVGGMKMLRSQLTAVDKYGATCLMISCRGSSPEVVELVLEEIVEAGDSEFLRSQIAATNNLGETCLRIVSLNSTSRELIKLFAEVLGALNLFKSQYSNLGGAEKYKLRSALGIKDASWAPDPETSTEVKRILKLK